MKHILMILLAAQCRFAHAATSAVSGYHPIAVEIGQNILNAGGNAFDAFVATTAADYVLSEGVTSLGGPLGALVYDAKSGRSYYLDAGFNSPLDSSGHFDPSRPEETAGAATFVPGAPAGLEAISKRFGRLPFKSVLKPAIDLARNGFPVSSLMARMSRNYSLPLKRSEYGRNTFLPNGAPLIEGQQIQLPIFAETLEKLAQQGARYMYRGAWARRAVRKIRASGGRLTAQDFARYRVKWREPLSIHYHGTTIYSPSGKTYGGLTTLLALKALENAGLTDSPHFSQDGSILEKVVLAEDWAEYFRRGYAARDNGSILENLPLIQTAIESDSKVIWEKIKANQSPNQSEQTGSHSYHVTVIDRDGNAITGTNTIEALPWAQGLFVDGVALTDSAILLDQTTPGERNFMPFSMHIGIKNSSVSFAVGAFGASLIPAELQFVLNATDFKMSAQDSMSFPRFGIEGIDLLKPGYPPTGKGRWLDRRIDNQVVSEAQLHGLKFDQDGMTVNGKEHRMDLGLGSMAIVRPGGSVEAAIAPMDVDPN